MWKISKCRTPFKRRSKKTCTHAVTHVGTEALPICYLQSASLRFSIPPLLHDDINTSIAGLNRFPTVRRNLMDSVVPDNVCLSRDHVCHVSRAHHTNFLRGKSPSSFQSLCRETQRVSSGQAQRQRSIRCARGGTLSI